MRRSPGMRCSLQGAIEQQNNWVAGAQSQERKTVGSHSEDAAYHSRCSVRYAIPTARSSAWEALQVRQQQHSTRPLLFRGVKIASASAVALSPPFATRPSAGCGP